MNRPWSTDVVVKVYKHDFQQYKSKILADGPTNRAIIFKYIVFKSVVIHKHGEIILKRTYKRKIGIGWCKLYCSQAF